MLFLLFLCILACKAATQVLTTLTPQQVCNSCFIVAQIDEAIHGAGMSYYAPVGVFTIAPSGLAGDVSLTALPTALVITYNDAPVTSPTVYCVITGYTSFTQTLNTAGICLTRQIMVVALAHPLSIQLPTDASSNVVTQVEEIFFNQLGPVTCSPGGAIVTTQVPVSVTTDTPIPTTALTVTLSEQFSATSTRVNQSSAGIASSLSSDDPGLSQSAKLGIGIGIGVPGTAILVLIEALFWKWNTRKKHMKERTDPLSELPSKEPDSLVELENKLPPQELENNVAPRSYLLSDDQNFSEGDFC